MTNIEYFTFVTVVVLLGGITLNGKVRSVVAFLSLNKLELNMCMKYTFILDLAF